MDNWTFYLCTSKVKEELVIKSDLCHCCCSCFIGYLHVPVSGSAHLSHTDALCPWHLPSREPEPRGRVYTSTETRRPGVMVTRRQWGGGRQFTGSQWWRGARRATRSTLSTSTRRSTRRHRVTRSRARRSSAPSHSCLWSALREGDTSGSMGGLTGTTAVRDFDPFKIYLYEWNKKSQLVALIYLLLGFLNKLLFTHLIQLLQYYLGLELETMKTSSSFTKTFDEIM